VLEKKLALDVGTSEAPGIQFPSLFYVRAMPAPGVTSERLRDEIQAIFDRLKTEPISEADLQAVRRRARISMLSGFNSNQGLAETMAESELIWGDWATMFKFYELLEKASADDVMRLARTYLNIPNRTFIKLERAGAAPKKGGVAK
jgi:predicted Zn-dependent peptidase